MYLGIGSRARKRVDALATGVILPYQPTERQQAFHSDPAPRRLYGGAVASGKSEAIMWEAVQQSLETPNWPVLLLRRTYGELEQSLIRRFLTKVPSGLYTWNGTEKIARFANGSTMRFTHVENEKDIYRFKSDEFGCVAIDELTTFSFLMFEYITSRMRTTIPNAFVNFIAGTNPGDIGHVWVKHLWITKQAAPGQDPGDYDPSLYSFIPARLTDNPYIQPGYEKTLRNLRPELREALLNGSWDLFAGQYFDVFKPAQHTVPPEEAVKEPWYPCWMSGDWGYKDQTVIHWHYQTPDRRVVTYRELTLTEKTPAEIGRSIVAVNGKDKPKWFFLSPDAFGTRISKRSIAQEIGDVLAANALPRPTQADDDRVGGWQLMYQLLESNYWTIVQPNVADEKGYGCPNLIKSLPQLVRLEPPRHEDCARSDVDHAPDAARYGLKTHLGSVVLPVEERFKAAIRPAGDEAKGEEVNYIQRWVLGERFRYKEKKIAKPMRMRGRRW